MINLLFDELRLIAQIRHISNYENKSKEDLIKALSKTKNKTKTRNTKNRNKATNNKTRTKTANTKTRNTKIKTTNTKITKPKPQTPKPKPDPKPEIGLN